MARTLAPIFLLAACRAVVALPELPAQTPNILAAIVGLPAPPLVTAPAFAVKANAATTDDGYLACVTAEAIEAGCLAVVGFTDLPAASQAECLCCLSTTFVADEYGSCAAYISESYMQTFATEYTVQTGVESFCQEQGNICGSATVAASVTSTVSITGTGTVSSGFASATGESPTTTRASSSAASSATGAGSSSGFADAEPPACTSAASIIVSCSRKDASFTDLPGSAQASCVCYTGTRYTTAFDNYVDSCATYISTASPDFYSDYAALSTFCEEYPPTATGAASSSTSTSDDDSETTSSSPFSFSSRTTQSTSSASPTATTTVTVQGGGSGGSATSTTAQPGLAASNGAVSWVAGALTFFLSFFVLI